MGGAALWLGTTITVGMLAATAAPSLSAEIHVFTSGAPAAVEKDVATDFSRATGHQVTVTVGNLTAIQEKLSAGENPDVVIFPTPAIAALEKAGKVVAGSQLDLARVGIGIAVREGAPLPDISSVEAIRKLLLNARSIVHPDPAGGGFTGAHIAGMIEKMGIADVVKPQAHFGIRHQWRRGGRCQRRCGNWNFQHQRDTAGERRQAGRPAACRTAELYQLFGCGLFQQRVA